MEDSALRDRGAAFSWDDKPPLHSAFWVVCTPL